MRPQDGHSQRLPRVESAPCQSNCDRREVAKVGGHRMPIAALLMAALAAGSSGLPPQCLGVAHPIVDVHSHAYSNDPRWAAHAPNPATGRPLVVTGEAGLRNATRAEYERRGVI